MDGDLLQRQPFEPHQDHAAIGLVGQRFQQPLKDLVDRYFFVRRGAAMVGGVGQRVAISVRRAGCRVALLVLNPHLAATFGRFDAPPLPVDFPLGDFPQHQPGGAAVG